MNDVFLVAFLSVALAGPANAKKVIEYCPGNDPKQLPYKTAVGSATLTPSARSGWKNDQLTNSAVRIKYELVERAELSQAGAARATHVVTFQCDMKQPLASRRAIFNFRQPVLAYSAKGQRVKVNPKYRDEVRAASKALVGRSGLGKFCSAPAIYVRCEIGPE